MVDALLFHIYIKLLPRQKSVPAAFWNNSSRVPLNSSLNFETAREPTRKYRSLHSALLLQSPQLLASQLSYSSKTPLPRHWNGTERREFKAALLDRHRLRSDVTSLDSCARDRIVDLLFDGLPAQLHFWDFDDDPYDENGDPQPAVLLAKQQAFAAFVLPPTDDAIIRCVLEKEVCYMLDLRRADRMDKYYSDKGFDDDAPLGDPDDGDDFVGGGDEGLAGGF